MEVVIATEEPPVTQTATEPVAFGKYNVILTLLSHMGKHGAAGVAASLRSSYGGVRLVLLVGIRGSVLRAKDDEILLGDEAVVSKTVVQCDFGWQYPGRFVRKDTVDDNLSNQTRISATCWPPSRPTLV
jgi:hypothetical protein